MRASPIEAAAIIATISTPVSAATGAAAKAVIPPVNGVAANAAVNIPIVTVPAKAIFFDFFKSYDM